MVNDADMLEARKALNSVFPRKSIHVTSLGLSVTFGCWTIYCSYGGGLAGFVTVRLTTVDEDQTYPVIAERAVRGLRPTAAGWESALRAVLTQAAKRIDKAARELPIPAEVAPAPAPAPVLTVAEPALLDVVRTMLLARAEESVRSVMDRQDALRICSWFGLLDEHGRELDYPGYARVGVHLLSVEHAGLRGVAIPVRFPIPALEWEGRTEAWALGGFADSAGGGCLWATSGRGPAVRVVAGVGVTFTLEVSL